MVIRPLWRNIHGFVLDGKHPTNENGLLPAVSGVRITTSILRTYNLTTIACDRWSLVTD